MSALVKRPALHTQCRTKSFHHTLASFAGTTTPHLITCLCTSCNNINATDKSKNTALYLATRSGHTAIVKLLLHAGANISPTEKYGWTALHVAPQSGRKAIVELLLHAGADVNATNDDQETALHMAARYGQNAIVELLLYVGANLNATDKSGSTALHFVADNRLRLPVAPRLKIVTALLDAGADINALTSTGQTALHHAVGDQVNEMVELLLDKGALITADSEGITALHLASSTGRAEIVTILLTGGAPIEERMSSGSSRLDNFSSSNFRRRVRDAVGPSQKPKALHLAVKHWGVEAVRVLLAHGAEFDSSSKDGTPLEIARRNGCARIIEMLEAAELRHRRSTNTSSTRTLGFSGPRK